MVVWWQTVVSQLLPSGSHGWLGAGAHCHCPVVPESIIPGIPSQEKIKSQTLLMHMTFTPLWSQKNLSQTVIDRDHL